MSDIQDLDDRKIAQGIFMLALVIGGRGHLPAREIALDAEYLVNAWLGPEEKENDKGNS